MAERRVFGCQVGGSQETLGDQASQSLHSAVDPSSLLHGSQVCGSVISNRNNSLHVQMPAACDRAEENPSTTEHLSGVTVLSLQSCPTLCDPVDCSSPGSSIHGILQARIPEWVPIPSSRGTSRPRDRTCVSFASCTGGRVLYHWTPGGAPRLLGFTSPSFSLGYKVTASHSSGTRFPSGFQEYDGDRLAEHPCHTRGGYLAELSESHG